MANKQTLLLLLKKNVNLCEINKEYPSLTKLPPMPRHLCTSEKAIKTSEPSKMDILSNAVITEHQEKESNKHAKNVQEQTEVIELFQYKPEEEFHNRFDRRCRYRRRDYSSDEDNETDNSN